MAGELGNTPCAGTLCRRMGSCHIQQEGHVADGDETLAKARDEGSHHEEWPVLMLCDRALVRLIIPSRTYGYCDMYDITAIQPTRL